MTTLAEGVETPEQLEMLSTMGCDQSQGYLHSRPLAAADLEPLLRNGAGPTLQKSNVTSLDRTVASQAG
jgi:EAL domain-containing protein (putative c-di-GMP-specific phosphodiesterase class I)